MLSEIEQALLLHLQEEGIDARSRPIDTSGAPSVNIIVIGADPIRLQLGLVLGLTFLGGEVELCNLEHQPHFPEGFPKDCLGFYELADPAFPDNLVAAIRSHLANGEAYMEAWIYQRASRQYCWTMHWIIRDVLLWLRSWLQHIWRPTRFDVCYVYKLGVGCDLPTKYSYRSIDRARAKVAELEQMTPAQLKAEGIDQPPFMFRILQVTSGHLVTRLLNLTGRKRLWKVFGYYI